MVHASSAVALAVVAFSAASTLAYPVVFGEDGLEMRSEPEFANIKRAAEQAAPPQGAHVPSATASADAATAANPGPKGPNGIPRPPTGKPGAKAGALPTVQAVWAPRPTVCKAGETPHAKNARQRLYVKGRKNAPAGPRDPRAGAGGPSSRRHRGHRKHGAGGAAPPSSSPAPPSAPALAPRAAPAAPTQAPATSASAGAPPTAPTAPTAPPGKGHGAKGNGKITTTTRKGRDGSSTVYHIHHGTKTLCYSQETGAAQGGQGAPGKAPSPSAAAGGEKPQKAPDATKPNPKMPAAGAGAPSKTTGDPKLAARYEELLERYYGEIDELD